MMFGVYLHCNDNSTDYENTVIKLLGYIEYVVYEHVGYKCMILGDFNFECKMSNAGYVEFNTGLPTLPILAKASRI